MEVKILRLKSYRDGSANSQVERLDNPYYTTKGKTLCITKVGICETP